MDLGRDPTADLFSGLIVISAVNLIGIESDLVPIEHWLLATNGDCIAVGALLSPYPCSEMQKIFLE